MKLQKLLSLLFILLSLCFEGCAVLRFVGVMKTEEEPKTLVFNDPAATPTPTPSPEPVAPQDPLATDTSTRPKKKILVVKFFNLSGFGGPELGEHASLGVKDMIESFSQYTYLGEETLEDHEPFATPQGVIDYKKLFEYARSLGVSAVVTGSVDKIEVTEKGDEVGLFRTKYQTVKATVSFKMHDTGNEKLLLAKTTDAQVTEEHTRFLSSKTEEDTQSDRGKSAVKKALDKVYPSFSTHAKKIAWAGRIAKIDLHRYYINAGEQSGIQKGQLLKVFGGGREIFDEESGASLGVAPGRFKGILKVVEFFGNDGSIAIMHSGAGFVERDRVETYAPPQ